MPSWSTIPRRRRLQPAVVAEVLVLVVAPVEGAGDVAEAEAEGEEVDAGVVVTSTKTSFTVLCYCRRSSSAADIVMTLAREKSREFTHVSSMIMISVV